MDRVFHAIIPSLYPLWMVSANLISRFGGMIILILIGHAFADQILGTYFALLATIGLAVTATQAGSGPLLIRLAQANQMRSALVVIAIRLAIALAATVAMISMRDHPIGLYWPLLLLPLAAALAPDWIIAARTEFSKLSLIAVCGQMAGIIVAAWVTLTKASIALFAIAPAISTASLMLGALLAYRSNNPVTVKSYELQHSNTGLIGFTLLAGFLPNLDFVLLNTGDDTVFLAQRIFLFCAGLIAAITATLFAKRVVGAARDIWLMAPMAAVSGMLLLGPGFVAHLIYADPNPQLIELIQTGALWPVLMAIISRQILILQENANAKWLGWFCLLAMVGTAFVLPDPSNASEVIILVQLRLAAILFVLLAWQRHIRLRRIRT
ncbi:MAG: hypothetical protein ACMZ66_07915 [Thalassospira sp.]|uniref:hypothetical protein n=1 Tax=Thalassospira sp. TaxID=1912094 RepID=UPI003A8B2BAA